jgi:diguanylate cyclase (GGDEF)-like protein/PAS domain S-box-containing protein
MDKIDRMLFERYTDINIIADDPVIRSRNSGPEQITERLIKYRNTIKHYITLSFFDMNRIVIADTSGTNIGVQHEFTEFWPGIAEGMDFVMSLAKSQLVKRNVFYFASVVKDNENKVFGVVVTRMPIEKIYTIISRIPGSDEPEKHIRIDMVDKSGMLLYSNYNKEGILKEILQDWDTVQQFIEAGYNKGSFIHTHPLEKEEKILAFARQQGYLDFKGNDWTLVIDVSTEVAFAPAVLLRNRMIIILIAAYILAICIIYLFSRRITRPLAKLSSASAEIGKGNFDVKADIASRDEMGQLASSFNTMAMQLKTSQEQLLAYSRELEIRVAERTAELEKAHKQLEQDFIKLKEAEMALVESEEKFRTMSGSAKDAIIMIDDEGNILFWNEAAKSVFGYTAEEVMEKDMHAFLAHPRYYESYMNGMKEFRQTGQGILIGKTFELTAMRKDGIEIPIELSVSAVKLKDKWNAIGLIRDITERKRMEDILRESEERYRDLFENTTDLIQTCTPEGRFVYVNRSWREALGYKDDDLENLTVWDIIHPDKLEHCREIFNRVLSGESIRDVEVIFVSKDGRHLVSEGSVNCFFKDGKPEYIRSIFHDITRRKRMEDDLRSMSLRDELTGLYNRRGFIMFAGQQLKIADRMKSGVSLLFADLDGLKQINDTFGHQEGDRAIIDTANVLEGTFRDSDIIARIGGDEFVVLGLKSHEMYFELLTSRLKENIDIYNAERGRPYKLMLSIGVSSYDPENPCSVEELLTRADKLMYEEKQRKKKI